MKILILTPDVTPKGMATGYNTGFSLMVDQIASDFAGMGHDVYMYSSSFVCNEMNTGGYHLQRRTIKDIVLSSRIRDWAKAFRYLFSGNIPLPMKKKLFKYVVSTGYIEKLIRKINPDIVHINSAMMAIFPFLVACNRCRKPFVITLHGLFSFVSPNDETYIEHTVLVKLLKAGNSVTCVSSGVRQRLLSFMGLENISNLSVVLNTFPAEVNIGQCLVEEGCIVSVGNINERKNQIQTLRAYSLLPLEIKEKHKICFIGKDCLDGKLRDEASRLCLEKYCIFTGTLPREDTYAWISKASVVVMASIDEGFGLPVIEGYRFGVPAVCFSDVDAFGDLYSPVSMVPVYERTDLDLSQAINTALTKEWDRDAIIKFSGKYSSASMVNAYIDVFKRARKVFPDNRGLVRWIDKFVMDTRDYRKWI